MNHGVTGIYDVTNVGGEQFRAFAAAWPNREIVQQLAAQIPWFHNCILLERVNDPEPRLWYARKAREEGWSRNILTVRALPEELKPSLPTVEEIEAELEKVEKTKKE